jgi:ABC-type sugar transport system permease subunit
MDSSTLFSLRLSLQVAITATILMVLFGIPVSYFLASKKFRGREIIDMLLTLPLVLPPTVTGYYLIILFGRSGYIGKILYQWTYCPANGQKRNPGRRHPVFCPRAFPPAMNNKNNAVQIIAELNLTVFFPSYNC